MNETSRQLLLRGLYERRAAQSEREADVKLLVAALAVAHEFRLDAEKAVREIQTTLLQSGVAPEEVEVARSNRPSWIDVKRAEKLLVEAQFRVERPQDAAYMTSVRSAGGGGGGNGA